MNEAVTNSTNKILEYEVTEEDVEQLRADGVSENEIPAVGTIRKWQRATRFAPRNEHERLITLHLSFEIVDFLKKRSNEPVESQIISELRKLMEAETNQKEKLRRELLNDTNFLHELREKLKAA